MTKIVFNIYNSRVNISNIPIENNNDENTIISDNEGISNENNDTNIQQPSSNPNNNAHIEQTLSLIHI